MKEKFFSSAEQFRQWLERNHDSVSELMVVFHKKASAKKSMTYHEALDEALCYGWIDGVRKRLNETSFIQRFTPRKPKSIWSLVNVRHIERLTKEGRMRPAGLKAFAQRDPKRTGIYAFENAPKQLSATYEKRFRQNRKAWQFFESQPPYFKKLMIHRVMSAKKEETQIRRLEQLIESSAQGIRLGLIVPNPKEE